MVMGWLWGRPEQLFIGQLILCLEIKLLPNQTGRKAAVLGAYEETKPSSDFPSQLDSQVRDVVIKHNEELSTFIDNLVSSINQFIYAFTFQ